MKFTHFLFFFSEASAFVGLEGAEEEKSGYPSLSLHNSFAFKFKDHKGRVHRLNSGKKSDFDYPFG